MTYTGYAYRQRPQPVRHDHVNHMLFEGEAAICDPGRGGCGQEWRLTWKTDAAGTRVATAWVLHDPESDTLFA